MTTDDEMPRPDARPLLREAALQLFRERGFEGTTVAAIADRVGVTERTFFRHFKDKKDVLFDDEATGCDVLLAAIGDAPAEQGPVEALFRAFRAFEPTMRDRRAYIEPRFRIVSANPALQEREFAKHAQLTDAFAASLRARCVDPLPAMLAARIGMAAFGDALEAWFDDPEVGYLDRLDRSYRELKGLVSAGDGH